MEECIASMVALTTPPDACRQDRKKQLYLRLADQPLLIDSASKLENMVYFPAELALLNYTALVYCPSMVAASAVYVARRILHKSPAWTEILKLHTQFTEAQLIDCANLLMTLHSTAFESKPQEFFRIYSRLERCAVALICRDRSNPKALTDYILKEERAEEIGFPGGFCSFRSLSFR